MKEKEITTVYDERYYALLTIKAKDLKQIMCGGEKYVGYINTVNRPPGKEPVVIGIFVKEENYKGKEILLLNRNEIMILNVLFHLTLNAEQQYIYTDLYNIHHKLLGRSVKMENEDDYCKIIRTFNRFEKQYVFIGHESELQPINNNLYLSQLANMQVLSVKEKFIRFTLGDFGNEIRNRKRYSDLIPIKFARCQNISKYFIALAICRYIYINAKKKNRLYSFKLVTILKQINYFDRNGNNTGKSYYDLLKQDGITNKTYILKQFIKSIKEVLNTLMSESKINGFNLLNFDDNASVLRYTNYIIELELPPRKYH